MSLTFLLFEMFWFIFLLFIINEIINNISLFFICLSTITFFFYIPKGKNVQFISCEHNEETFGHHKKEKINCDNENLLWSYLNVYKYFNSCF